MNKILMVGSGGTGTMLLAPLIAYLTNLYGSIDRDVWQLGVMDGDSVEEKNFARQLFDPNTVNVNKAEAALLPYRYMSNVIPIKEFLGADNINQYVDEDMTILICVDNMPVRAKIEDRCLQLDNVVVINGGNEFDTGSCQIWIRKNGLNVTPKLSFLHPEIRKEGIDRAELSCQEIATLPGGEQLIVTNMASALHMLNALMAVHNEKVTWTEAQFNLGEKLDTFGIDNRFLM